MSESKKSCLDCPMHKIIADPDPEDWFCDDDMAVVCTKTPNDDQNPSSKYASDRQGFKEVTSSCRPYNLRKETEVPEWCPLNV
jgi:hypothetical protein